MSSEYLSLYPELKPNHEYQLKVDSLHQLYFASYGNQSGIPVITLHGGPGSGSAPYFAQFFDPNLYHIIVADQRGSGLSTPKGEIQANTTAHLIADLEMIRETLAISQWVVFGGSWGSTLALLYAEAYPHTVLGLILRGIFLARQHDLSVFTREDCPAALIHSTAWQCFKDDTQQLLRKANLEDKRIGDTIYQIYYQLLTQADQSIAEKAAATLAAWEKRNSFLLMDENELNWSYSPDGINMGKMEAYYFENQCFIRPNQILEEIGHLKGIQIYIIQGIYDLICPSYQANELESALRTINAQQELIVRYNTLAGHSQKEAATRHALIIAAQQLANKIRK